MPLYRYKIADSAGSVSETVIEAENQKDAVGRLRLRKVVVLEFLGDANDLGTRNTHIFKRHRFDAIDFTDRLVPLLQSGITLEKSLHVLHDATENPDEKSLISDLRRGLHEGKPLSKLIRDRGKLFPRIYANIVEAGEESGSLPEVMAELRKFLLSGREMQGFLISSSIYPLFILAVSIGVLLLILGIIVPKFALVFKSTGKALPGSLKLLMDTSEFINSFWWLGIIAVAGLLFLIRAIKKDGPIREHWEKFLLKLPIVGKVIHFSNIARMLRTMSVLIRSGVHLLNAVTIAVKVIDNSLIRNSLSYLGNDLRKGEKISYCFSKSKFMPTMVVRMLTVGEETGQPSEMMANIADRMEDDVKKRLKRVIALFEPVMIVVLALVVGAILAVMFMSIMDMQSF